MACDCYQRTRPLLAILNFKMRSTSVFSTEKKGAGRKRGAKAGWDNTQVGFHACCYGRWTWDPDAATAKSFAAKGASEWNKAAASGPRGPSCIVAARFFISALSFPTNIYSFWFCHFYYIIIIYIIKIENN